MNANENHDPPPSDDGNYAWLRHAAWNIVAPDRLPTASGPMIYEGFIPQQNQRQPVYRPQHSISESRNGYTLSHQQSQYPPLDQNGFSSEFNGGPVQPPAQSYNPGYSTGLKARTHLLPSPFGPLRQLDDAEDDEEMSIDEGENFSVLETELESEVDGVVRGLRSRGRGRGRGNGQRGGRGPRRSKRRGKGGRTGPRAVLDPGPEFQNLHREATEAFIGQQDYDTALELILKAIEINPEITSAHGLLSDIYFARGDDERGLAALFGGAHAAPNNPAVWHHLADVCLQKSSMDRLTMLNKASYCFRVLLKIDQQDHDARFQKAVISRELGHHAKALKDLDRLLKNMPHNSSILRQIAEICLDINDVGRAIGLYDDALEHQRLSAISGHEQEEGFTWADLIVYVDLIARPNGASQAAQVLKSIARWLLGREDESYWEEFGGDDREWDAEHQPRRSEVPLFDPSRHRIEAYGVGLPLELRIKLGDLRLKSGHRQEALNHFEWLAPDDRDEGAPLYEYSDLFLQVADALREIKCFEQALRYYEALYSVKTCDDVDFWLGLGACSYVCEKRDQALHCYQEAMRADPTSGEARTQLSKLFAERGMREKALHLARSAIMIYEGQLPKTQRRKYERRDLREAREAAQKAFNKAKSIPLPQSGINVIPRSKFSRKRGRQKSPHLSVEVDAGEASRVAEDEAAEDGPGQHQAQADQRAGSLTPPRRQEGAYNREDVPRTTRVYRRREKTTQNSREAAQQLYLTLCGVTAMMRDGNDDARDIWMDCAESLVKTFRLERAFYPPERYIKFQGFDRPHKKPAQPGVGETSGQARQDVPLPSVESSVPTDFCGIEFTDWLDIFLEYAMLLANTQDDRTECYTVITACLDCNIWYHDPDTMFQIYACWLTCALALNDENTLFNTVLRWFMREHVFCTDVYRLFGAMNLYYPHLNDKGGKAGQMNNAIFRAGPNQKFLFRQVMGIDNQLPENYGSDQPDGPVPEFMRKPQNDFVYMSDKKQRLNEAFRSSVQSEAANADEDEAPTPVVPANMDDQPAHRIISPTELDVVLLIVYGQVLYAGGSFPNALSYFYRAYNVDPRNPMVLLSIAFSYIHQMLKRQNENRHMYLLQGWSFFEEYADARTEWAKQLQQGGDAGVLAIVKREIEFNRARCWQMLGMSNLAFRSYRNVMDTKLVKAEEDTSTDINNQHKDVYNMEAAYAMATMYAVNGDMDSATMVTEECLVVE